MNFSQVNVTEAMLTMFKDKMEIPPFLLSIQIFRKHHHNCLIYSSSSCNIMPFSISWKLGVTPHPTNQVLIQLDKIALKVIRVLKYVCIQLTTNSHIQDVIDIHVVDIPKTYGILFRREWTKFLRDNSPFILHNYGCLGKD